MAYWRYSQDRKKRKDNVICAARRFKELWHTIFAQFNSERDGNWVSCNHKGLFGSTGKFIHSTKRVSDRPEKGRRIFQENEEGIFH